MIGTVFGIFLTLLINFLISNSYQQYPPNVILIPYGLVFLTDFIIFLITFVFSFISLKFFSKANISKNLVE